jgi:hypothetical protein
MPYPFPCSEKNYLGLIFNEERREGKKKKEREKRATRRRGMICPSTSHPQTKQCTSQTIEYLKYYGFIVVLLLLYDLEINHLLVVAILLLY